MSHSLGKCLFTALLALASATVYGQYGLDNGQVSRNNGQAAWFPTQAAPPNTQPGRNYGQPNQNYAQPGWKYAQSGFNNNYIQPNNTQFQPNNTQPVWNGRPIAQNYGAPNYGAQNYNQEGWQNARPQLSNAAPIWNSAQPGQNTIQYSSQPGSNPTLTPLESLPTVANWPRIAQAPNAANDPSAANVAPVQAPTNSPSYYTDGCAGGCQGGCTSCAPCNCTPCRAPCRWYGSVGGLVMGRSRGRRVWTTYETGNNSNQTTHTQLDTTWRGGMEFHLGRKFCCGAWALDLGYWTIEDFESSISQTHPNSVSSPLLFNDLEFPTGVLVANIFNGAAEHRISRRNRIQNVELNLIENRRGSQLYPSNNSLWNCQKILGLRYFRFDEDLVFSSLDQGGTWGGNGGLDEATLQDTIENQMLGAQVGCQWLRRIGSRGSLFITPKFGIYNNHINNRFDLRRGDGAAAAPNAFSNVAGSYPVTSSTDVLSFLSELNVGMAWQPASRWSIFGGYRVLVLSGIGTADSQIPQYIVDIPEIADIDYVDTLIIHGAFAGVSYSF